MSVKFARQLRVLSGLFLLLLFSASCHGVQQETETEPPETEPVRVYTADDLNEIVLTADREEVTAGVGDIVAMTAVGYADDGSVIKDIEFEYYADGKRLSGAYFAPVDTGVYNLFAMAEGKRSNSIEINSHEPEIITVDFSLKEYSVTTGETITFNVNADSAYGRAKAKDSAVTINGETKHFLVYEMSEEGVYPAYVTAGGIDSPVRMFSVSNRIRYDLTLKADIKTAKPGDTVHFSYTAKNAVTGREISSGSPELKLWGTGKIEDGYTFGEPGVYSFYLEYNGEVSETVVIDVKDDIPAAENGFEGYATDLPAIVIDTGGKTINAFKSLPCTVCVYGNKGGGVENGQLPDIVTKGEIKVRGQSSAGFPKRQYSLHTINEDGSNNNIKLLGMPKENDWVLNGSYADKSLIRNGLAQTMLSEVMDYTPRTEYCEVYIRQKNGVLDYIGVYTLLESIKIDKDRVNIEKLDADDNLRPEITGGYIVSFDKLKGDENTVDTTLGIMTIVKPSKDNITPAQDTYIKEYLKDFARTLRSDKRSDPENGLTAYIDPESVAPPLIMTELMKNIDGFAISTYFYKDREDVLRYGPSWDYDLTFGNADYNDGTNPEGWYVLNYTSFARNMMRDNTFAQLVIDTWRELRNDILTDENLDRYIDEELEKVGEAAVARSCARWPNHWDGTYVWPNHNAGEYYTSSHAEEIEKMRTFLHRRAKWMDRHIDELLTLVQ